MGSLSGAWNSAVLTSLKMPGLRLSQPIVLACRPHHHAALELAVATTDPGYWLGSGFHYR